MTRETIYGFIAAEKTTYAVRLLCRVLQVSTSAFYDWIGRGRPAVGDDDLERTGTVLAPCGNRREAVCPACSDRNRADAFHLLRAGLAGDDTKNIPDTVADRPRAFLILTAPSFGPVHTRALTRRGHVTPADAGSGTAATTRGSGQPSTSTLTTTSGQCSGRHTQEHCGPGSPPPCAAPSPPTSASEQSSSATTPAVLREDRRIPTPQPDPLPRRDPPRRRRRTRPTATSRARRPAHPSGGDHRGGSGHNPDRRPAGRDAARPRLGVQLDLREVTPTARRQIEDEHGEITDLALAGYIAKYATKTTGTTDGADRPIRDRTYIEHLAIPDHHRRMITTAWDLSGMADYEGLHLRRWAHMLGFRGHFLTKSRRYSVTFTALRGQRRTWRLAEDLAQLGRNTDDPNDVPPDLDTITVVNDWWPVHYGHRDDAERELAAANAQRHRTARHGAASTIRRVA